MILRCNSTISGSVTIPILSLLIRNCLLPMCFVELINDASPTIKEIYAFTKEYLLSWFPHLPSYQTFNYRLNLMSEAISFLVKL